MIKLIKKYEKSIYYCLLISRYFAKTIIYTYVIESKVLIALINHYFYIIHMIKLQKNIKTFKFLKYNIMSCRNVDISVRYAVVVVVIVAVGRSPHYYPEAGCGWIILATAAAVHVLKHGLQLLAAVMLRPVEEKHKLPVVNVGQRPNIFIIIF